MTRWNNLPDEYQKKKNSKKVYKSKDEEVKLIIPGELPTMNEIINKSKTHWAKYGQMKGIYDDTVAWFATQQEIPFFEAVKLNITYFRKNKRVDPDNISAGKKFIIDGLVKSGVLENDGWKEIKGFEENWKVDKNNPRVEVVLKNMKEEKI